MDYYFKNETGELVKADSVIITDDGTRIENPTSEQYSKYLKAYPIGECAPRPLAMPGAIEVLDGYDIFDGMWHQQWKPVDCPKGECQ